MPSPPDFTAFGLTRRRFLAAASGAGAGLLAVPGHASAPVLRLGDQKGGIEALLNSAGLFRDLPYRLEIKQFVAAAPLLEALNAGAVDLAWAGDAPTTFALANGTPARIVAAHRASGAGTALLVKPESPVSGVADLVGRTIATGRGSIGHALVLAALKANKLPFDAVKFAFLLPAEAKVALQSGAVDAWSTWGVFVAQAMLIDTYRQIVDGSNGLLSGLGYVIAHDSAIASKRGAIGDIVARTARARAWAVAHADDYARDLAGIIGVSFDVAKRTHETAPPLPVPIDATVIADQQRTADLYADAGLITRRVDVARFFDSSFNNSAPT